MTESFNTRLSQAVQLKKSKKYQPAWELFQVLADDNPRSAYFWSNFAHLALLMNRWRQAKEFVETALSLEPNHRFSRSLHARVLLHFQELTDALDTVRQLDEAKPNLFLLRSLVKAFERADRLPELADLFNDWLQRHGDDADFVSIAAEYFHKIGNNEKAIELYQNLMKRGKANDYAYQRLIALKTVGKSHEEKVRQLEMIVKMPEQGKNVHLLGLLAQEYKKLGEFDKAEQIYRTIAKLAPQDLFQRKQTGFLYAKKGDHAQAIEILSRCLLDDPDDVYVRSALFAAYHKQGDKEGAKNLIRQILARYPEKKIYYGQLKKVEKW